MQCVVMLHQPLLTRQPSSHLTRPHRARRPLSVSKRLEIAGDAAEPTVTVAEVVSM